MIFFLVLCSHRGSEGLFLQIRWGEGEHGDARSCYEALQVKHLWNKPSTKCFTFFFSFLSQFFYFSLQRLRVCHVCRPGRCGQSSGSNPTRARLQNSERSLIHFADFFHFSTTRDLQYNKNIMSQCLNCFDFALWYIISQYFGEQNIRKQQRHV